ncbi:MAG: hypothetical protein HYY18_11615 [Planctomycetes bacterium]|nr:hypothetical protein [Planctomycetota bacterium]
MKRLFAPVLLGLALCARADELSERVEAAAAKCASEDPAERVEGARMLVEIADVDATRVMALLGHADPEVAGAAAGVLENRGIFVDPAKSERCGELLEALTREDLKAEERRPLVAELLNLGAPAVAIVEAELATSETADVAEPVLVLDAGVEQVVPLQLKNTGRRGLWYPSGLLNTWSHVEPFGRRPLGGRSGGGSFRSRFGCGGGEPPAPEEVVLRFLSSIRRVAPGATFEAGACKLSGARCGIVSISSNRISTNTRRSEAVFSGRALVNETAPVSVFPTARVVLLAERQGPSFRLAATRGGDGWALEVEALADGAALNVAGLDPLWWAAEGEGRAFLGSGPMRVEDVEDAAWKTGEVRRFSLPEALPAGTSRLWFGYDRDFTAEKPEQYVAGPVEIGGR